MQISLKVFGEIPEKDLGSFSADFVTSIDSDTSSYEVEKSTSSPVFWKRKTKKNSINSQERKSNQNE